MLSLNFKIAYFENGRKKYLRVDTIELGKEVNDSLRTIDLRDWITKSVNFEEYIVREIATVVNE